ncbi:MAG: N-acyl homoserine lactonase family protein [SAR324 cluster bacterium]|nr:N-acyl homoserine lactonase family protein [SAR324 cluster bacterium]
MKPAKPYKIYIMQYAARDTHTSQILLGDPHRLPVGMAYYMWALSNGEHTVVVDMGFTEEVCKMRERSWVADPAARLDAVGIDPAKVEHVIVTHMHWDHVGNYALFPNATFYVQEDEMAFWTGPYAKYQVFQRSMEIDDVVALVRHNYGGRIGFCQGMEEIVPGIRVHRVSGHTKGMQIVEVATASGTAVVASDASHYYRNYQEHTPFTTLHGIPGFLDGFELVRRLASREELILPGHDPQVLQRHPLHCEGVAVLE